MSDQDYSSDRFSDNAYSSQSFDPEHPPITVPRRSSVGCWIWALLLGGGFLILVCGGGGVLLFRFGLQVLASQIEDELADNPIVLEHIGQIESLELDFGRSAAHEDADTFIYQVRGTKGSGRITVKHVTAEGGGERILAGELRLPNGETFDLMPPGS